MVYRLCHVASSDLTKHSEKFIKQYLADATSSIPKVQDLASTLISCDLIMEIFQKAKQNVLNAFDVALQNLSIEKNSCS
jgi:23S rRNA G2445 N2-methylase RlmL